MCNESVYVSICCLGTDEELEHTIISCFENAANPENIFVGIAFVGDQIFADKIKNKFKNIKNISYSYDNFKNNIGIGRSRFLASQLYNNETYFFQIDAHTRFANKWDDKLIKIFKKSQIIVNNEKVVLTKLPGIYKYNNKEDEIIFSDIHGLVQWIPNEFVITYDNFIPRWNLANYPEIPDSLMKKIIKNGICPSSKIMASYMFGDHSLAKSISKEKIIWWEEEIIQSVELIYSGFTLIYPGTENHIYHLYAQDIKNKGRRSTLDFFLENNMIDGKQMHSMIKNNYFEYYKNNIDKVKKFEKYSNIDYVYGTKSDSAFALEYINVGYLPIN